MGYMGQPNTSVVVAARSHDTLGASQNAARVNGKQPRHRGCGKGQPRSFSSSHSAVPYGSGLLPRAALSLTPRRGAGIEPGLHGRAFPQSRGGKVMVGSRSRLQ